MHPTQSRTHTHAAVCIVYASTNADTSDGFNSLLIQLLLQVHFSENQNIQGK